MRMVPAVIQDILLDANPRGMVIRPRSVTIRDRSQDSFWVFLSRGKEDAWSRAVPWPVIGGSRCRRGPDNCMSMISFIISNHPKAVRFSILVTAHPHLFFN
jgi:hypothetical protein